MPCPRILSRGEKLCHPNNFFSWKNYDECVVIQIWDSCLQVKTTVCSCSKAAQILPRQMFSMNVRCGSVFYSPRPRSGVSEWKRNHALALPDPPHPTGGARSATPNWGCSFTPPDGGGGRSTTGVQMHHTNLLVWHLLRGRGLFNALAFFLCCALLLRGCTFVNKVSIILINRLVSHFGVKIKSTQLCRAETRTWRNVWGPGKVFRDWASVLRTQFHCLCESFTHPLEHGMHAVFVAIYSVFIDLGSTKTKRYGISSRNLCKEISCQEKCAS